MRTRAPIRFGPTASLNSGGYYRFMARALEGRAIFCARKFCRLSSSAALNIHNLIVI
jgi:hypothetical protein